MSYTPHEWTTGETITAGKLNHLENGVAGNQILTISLTLDGEYYVMDKTWKEISDAFEDGIPSFLFDSLSNDGTTETLPITSAYVDEGEYGVLAYSYYRMSDIDFVAISENAYPKVEDNSSIPTPK